MKVGVDFDGVLCTEPKWLELFWPFSPAVGVYLRERFARPLYLPRTDDLFIISGRPSVDIGPSLDWLRKHKVKCSAIYLNQDPATVGYSILWKEKMIKVLDLDIYIESEPEVAYLLEKLTGREILLPTEGGASKWLRKI